MKIPVRPTFVFIPWTLVLSDPLLYESVIRQESVRITLGDEECADGLQFNAFVADTRTELTQGLSGRREPLRRDEAMLFPFHPAREATFWMKETYIPLSIGFFDENGRLVSVQRMSVESDPSDPEGRYLSPGRASAAIETAPESLSPEMVNRSLCIEILQIPT